MNNVSSRLWYKSHINCIHVCCKQSMFTFLFYWLTSKHQQQRIIKMTTSKKLTWCLHIYNLPKLWKEHPKLDQASSFLPHARRVIKSLCNLPHSMAYQQQGYEILAQSWYLSLLSYTSHHPNSYLNATMKTCNSCKCPICAYAPWMKPSSNSSFRTHQYLSAEVVSFLNV